MSVKISSNKDDELNVVFIKQGHPLKTLQSVNCEDDVLYLHISKDLLKEIIWRSQEALKDNEDFQILFTGDIKLRHDSQITMS
ncbi:MAG: hypothetical protein WC373_08880 [Smithella sp.]|jgi:hypothetical protein